MKMGTQWGSEPRAAERVCAWENSTGSHLSRTKPLRGRVTSSRARTRSHQKGITAREPLQRKPDLLLQRGTNPASRKLMHCRNAQHKNPGQPQSGQKVFSVTSVTSVTSVARWLFGGRLVAVRERYLSSPSPLTSSSPSVDRYTSHVIFLMHFTPHDSVHITLQEWTDETPIRLPNSSHNHDPSPPRTRRRTCRTYSFSTISKMAPFFLK